MIYNEKSITEKRKKLYSSKVRVRTAAGAILFYLLFILVLTIAAGTAGFLYGSFRGVLDDIPEEYSLEPKETMTIIYDGARNLAPNLLAEEGSVGIRVTNEYFSKQLCLRFRKAIVSTSANISGTPSPANFSEISEEIKQAVDYIVESRRDEKTKAKPSSIVKLSAKGEIKIIRM